MDHDGPVLVSGELAYSLSWEPNQSLWRLRRDGRILFDSIEAEAVCATLLTELHHEIATRSPYLFVHAGVVVWKSRAILLPGRSFAGKTTLVTSLVDLGAKYFSDEFAVIETTTGRVFSFPRPPGIRDARQRKSRRPLAGSRSGVDSAEVGSVWFLAFQESGAWDVKPVSVGWAALGLFQNTIAAERFGDEALSCYAKMLETGRLWRGTRGSASPAAARILECLDSRSGDV